MLGERAGPHVAFQNEDTKGKETSCMPELTEIKGVGPVLAKACTDNGYGSVDKIATAMQNDLVAVPGISEAKAKLLISAAQALLNEATASLSGAAAPDVASTELEEKKSKKKKKKDKKKKKGKSKKEKKKKAKKKGKKS
jgi:hypothetical protein